MTTLDEIEERLERGWSVPPGLGQDIRALLAVARAAEKVVRSGFRPVPRNGSIFERMGELEQALRGLNDVAD